jgi:hypothetical protein
MTKTKLYCARFAAIGLALAVLAVAAPAVRAQMDPVAPVVVKREKIKAIWMHAEVIHADHSELVVREAGKEMAVHTFSYGPKAAAQIERAISAGGYQRGDAIKIHYAPGQTVAIEIKGKPSRPI